MFLSHLEIYLLCDEVGQIMTGLTFEGETTTAAVEPRKQN